VLFSSYDIAGIHFRWRPFPGAEQEKGVYMKLAMKYKAMREKMGSSYMPRTRHIDQNGWAEYTNRLFLESSPYLLQHAHNPVNWYPWGDEAFDTARKKGIPVLLSVGYSTCHWCHVMEEESFENIEIASYINKNYIAVKVDREERPDVDAVYMSAVQAITGRGGWPMTVWLNYDKKPFYGGTYFPAQDGDRGASMGFLTILYKLKQFYDDNPEQVQNAGVEITRAIQKSLSPAAEEEIKREKIYKTAILYFKSVYDKTNGGVIGAPKFPNTMPVRLLLKLYCRTSDRYLIEIAEQTLVKMAHGGIYDQVGGGFHRYSTDDKWFVPHFEKMLYDNALLVMAYLDGFQVTKNPLFKQIVEETLLYIKRDMTSYRGGFFSATDADSLTPDGKSDEGHYFTWTYEELIEALGEKEGGIVAHYYNITESGNFEGRNIFNINASFKTAAKDMGISEELFLRTVSRARSTLCRLRNKRALPLRDEKILTAWNGLMISAFARAGLILGNHDYIDTAKKAASFILQNLFSRNRLLRTYKDEKAYLKAYLDDYAFFTAALLDLFEADPDPLWITKAVELDTTLNVFYEDKKAGGFFMTANDHETLIAREKPGSDGATPSGNAVAAMNLFRLAKFTGKKEYRDRGERCMNAFSAIFDKNPAMVSEMMLALDFSLDRSKEIVVVSLADKK